MVFEPKSKNDRVLIVDFNHMAHNFTYGGVRLTKNLKVGNNIETIDTTIANGTIKNIFNWSRGGRIPTVVCFDRPCPSRKAYFLAEQSQGVDGEYKGKRESMSQTMYSGVALAQDYLERGGVSCLALHNWEADDLVFLAIQQAKRQYPNHYIDVITNDADMLPLVDEQVSVFFRSKKFTWAEDKSLEKNRYIQVTPKNFQEVVEGLSAFKGLYIPYNSLLLYKILRGDSADGIVSPFKKLSMTPRRLATIVYQLENGVLNEGYSHIFEKGSNYPVGIKDDKTKEYYSWVDMEEDVNCVLDRCYKLKDGKQLTYNIRDLFTYTAPERLYFAKDLNEYVSVDVAKEIMCEFKDKEGNESLEKPIVVHYTDNPKLAEMCEALSSVGLSEEEIEIFKKQYRGMNLAQPFPDLPKEIRRFPKRLNNISGFNGRDLYSVVSVLGINLNSRYL